MNYMKIMNKYIFPVCIIILLVAFIIWAATTTKEGYVSNVVKKSNSPSGSILRNEV